MTEQIKVSERFPAPLRDALKACGLTQFIRNSIDVGLCIRLPATVTDVDTMDAYLLDNPPLTGGSYDLDTATGWTCLLKCRQWPGFYAPPPPPPSIRLASTARTGRGTDYVIDVEFDITEEVTRVFREYYTGTISVNIDAEDIRNRFGLDEDDMADTGNVIQYVEDLARDMLESGHPSDWGDPTSDDDYTEVRQEIDWDSFETRIDEDRVDDAVSEFNEAVAEYIAEQEEGE